MGETNTDIPIKLTATIYWDKENPPGGWGVRWTEANGNHNSSAIDGAAIEDDLALLGFALGGALPDDWSGEVTILGNPGDDRPTLIADVVAGETADWRAC